MLALCATFVGIQQFAVWSAHGCIPYAQVADDIYTMNFQAALM